MYCWKCGQEITEGTSVCHVCGVDQKRTEPVSEAGKAMRLLYDRYGREQVLTNSLMLCNGLGDLMENSQKLRDHIKIAMNAGLGRMVKDQLDSVGRPDPDYDSRVLTLLTEEAGLSEKISKELAGYFDEMIGWREPAKPKPLPEPEPMPDPVIHSNPVQPSSHEEIDPKTGKVYHKGETIEPPPIPEPAPPTTSPRGRRRMYAFDWIALCGHIAFIIGGFTNSLNVMVWVSTALFICGAVVGYCTPMPPEDKQKKIPVLGIVFCCLTVMWIFGVYAALSGGNSDNSMGVLQGLAFIVPQFICIGAMMSVRKK